MLIAGGTGIDLDIDIDIATDIDESLQQKDDVFVY